MKFQRVGNSILFFDDAEFVLVPIDAMRVKALNVEGRATKIFVFDGGRHCVEWVAEGADADGCVDYQALLNLLCAGQARCVAEPSLPQGEDVRSSGAVSRSWGVLRTCLVKVGGVGAWLRTRVANSGGVVRVLKSALKYFLGGGAFVTAVLWWAYFNGYGNVGRLAPAQDESRQPVVESVAADVGDERKVLTESASVDSDKRVAMTASEWALFGRAVVGEGAIVVRPAKDPAKMLVVFEDPLCGNCRDFTEDLEALDGEYGYTVIPIGMMRPESSDLAAQALCAKDRGAEWVAVMTSGRGKSQSCDSGLEQVKANNKLFTDLGFTHTPMLVKAGGGLVMGKLSVDGVKAWLRLGVAHD